MLARARGHGRAGGARGDELGDGDGAPGGGEDRAGHEVMDVSEEDVATILPRVISHRVRVRDGPEDELLGSLVFCAAGPAPGKGQWERKTVKDIMVKILTEV